MSFDKAARLSRRACGLVWALLVLAHCGRGASRASRDATPAAATVADGGAGREEAAVQPEDPRAADLWAHAADGDADDLERLYAYVGSDALMEAASTPARHLVAIRALAWADDFVALPFLASIAASGTDEEASAALESVVAIASRPRRSTDPEDAIELRTGLTSLLALAKEPTRPPRRRTLAVRALRLFVDRGWVPRSEVPVDLDAR